MATPNVENVRGHNNLYPDYFFDHLLESTPFMVSFAKKRKTFSYFAYKEIYPQIQQWQQKKPFETTEQWKQRVTEENQKKKVQELTELEKQYYIKVYPSIYSWLERDSWAGQTERTLENQWSKTQQLLAQAKTELEKGKSSREKVNGTLGEYDADYGSYPVTLYPDITVFAEVPLSEAAEFKDKWNKVKISPTYGVVGDTLSVTACTFTLGKKAYKMLPNTVGDESGSLAFDLPSINIGLEQNGNKGNAHVTVPTVADNSVDTDIPTAKENHPNTFAVIIGNENYQRVAKVQYAANDAKVFGEYCQKTLGIPQNNIRSYKDATYGSMLAALKDIQSIAKVYKGNIDVIFYYAGHGIPNELDQSAYLLPVDADGTETRVCLSTKELYQVLKEIGAKQVIVLMDACFSGAQRGEGMLASARGVALKVKENVPTGNMVVFTAANGDQTAYPYKEKGHGMFTYFLLKKLQETKGNVTLGALTDYVSEQVAKQSIVVNKRSQTPTVIPSVAISDSWRNMMLQ